MMGLSGCGLHWRWRSFGMFAALWSVAAFGVPASITAADTLRVMTFNIWVGGESGGRPLDETVKVIQASKADVVGIQESHGEKRNGEQTDAAAAIARKLSWHYFDQGDEDNGIISRYKFVEHTPNKIGAAIELPTGKKAWIFNVHLMHTPYQPYQLLRIPYNDAPFIQSSDAAVLEARQARGGQVLALIKEVEDVRREETPIFVTGDFNEPSGLDWTDAVAAAGRCPISVPWPSTVALKDAGFTDAYRAAHPDPLKRPGYTWTPITAEDDPTDRHDRIDFVFFAGAHVRVEAAEVVGERPERADIVVAPYPSDHRGVVATFTLE